MVAERTLAKFKTLVSLFTSFRILGKFLMFLNLSFFIQKMKIIVYIKQNCEAGMEKKPW